MLPSLVTEIPNGAEWLYEVKYDGFRALIYLYETHLHIISRNLNELNDQFPEIIDGFTPLLPKINTPIILDGELCILETKQKASFEQIQKRGRLKTPEKIAKASKTTPATFMAFDLLMEQGELLVTKPLFDRKKKLSQFFSQMGDPSFLQMIHIYEDSHIVWEEVGADAGEGIVAKRKDSFWYEGKRTKQWLKVKNMQIATFFLLSYDERNAFFQLGCLIKGEIVFIGKVGQGFTKEEKEALITVVKKNQLKTAHGITYVNPSVCIEVEFLEINKNELRHPKFRRFRFDKHWEECTWEAISKVEQK